MKDPRIEAAARALYEQESRESGSPDPWPTWDSEDNAAREIFRTHATAAIAAIDNASTITTVEELDALPIGSVILDGDPAVLQMVEKSSLVGSEWAMANEGHIYTTGKITLPARVLHWGNNA